MKNGRVLEEVLEEIDLNVGKLSEFPAGDKMDKTEKRRKRVKPKKAGIFRYRPNCQYFYVNVIVAEHTDLFPIPYTHFYFPNSII